MVIAFSSIGLTFHPSNLTASGSQSFAETQGDSKGHSPWRAFGDFPRDGKVTKGAEHGKSMLSRSACIKGASGGCLPLQKSPGSEA